MRTLSFNNDVVVEVFNTSKGLYDFNIYTDVNKEYVERDDDAYRILCNDACFYFYVSDDEKSYGLNRKTLCQILRKVREVVKWNIIIYVIILYIL